MGVRWMICCRTFRVSIVLPPQLGIISLQSALLISGMELKSVDVCVELYTHTVTSAPSLVEDLPPAVPDSHEAAQVPAGLFSTSSSCNWLFSFL